MTSGLEGKVALVTGASRGIGAAIAHEFAASGADLFLTARGLPDLTDVAQVLRENTKRAVAFREADLRVSQSAEALVEQTVATFGRLDVLVNCAGDTRTKPFFEASDEDWLDAFGVKFHGAVRLARGAWPHLRATRGCIVIVAGNTSRTGHAEKAINGAVNAALVHFTKALSDLGRREGVRVNAINPGRTATRRLDHTLDRLAQERSLDRAEALRELLSSSGISRVAEPREIAWLAAYLASPQADFIQGAVVDIDGGETRSV